VETKDESYVGKRVERLDEERDQSEGGEIGFKVREDFCYIHKNCEEALSFTTNKSRFRFLNFTIRDNNFQEASSQTIRDDSERTILNRRQSIASMLGSAAAIPMFALQTGWNNLQRNFDYMKYGLYNGLQNFGQALNNGYYGAQQALYNAVYNAPYNTYNPYAYNMPGYGGYPQMSGYGGYPQMPGYGGYPQMPGWWGRLN
jgi:hypothetical protein